MKEISTVLAVLTFATVASAAPMPLREATFSHVINDVKTVKTATQAMAAAKQNDLFQTPDLVRTGKDSLAELTAADRTITRVGANTVFSFSDSGRTVNLQQGSLLFHSPKGKGGGTIKTGGAAAAVLGTTLIVSATADGGFKVVVLEGKAQVTLPNGDFRVLTAGQLLFVLPGSNQFGPRLDINLAGLVKASRLVNGFPEPLPSMPQVDVAIARQEKLIGSGQAVDTQLQIGNFATRTQVEILTANTVQPRFEDLPIPQLPQTSALSLALNEDIVIQSQFISEDHPRHFFIGPETVSVGPFSTANFSGLLGRNITVDHPNVLLDPNNGSQFDMLAAGTLTLNNVTGPFPGQISFINPGPLPILFSMGGVGGTFIAPGHDIYGVNLSKLEILSGTSMNLNNVYFSPGNSFGPVGSLILETRSGDLSLINCNVDTAFLDLVAAGNLTINSLNPEVGSFMYAQAGQNINVTSLGFFTAPPSLAMVAGNQLSMNFVDFVGTAVGTVTSISLDARTLVLQNVSFPGGSSVMLKSEFGTLAANPNTGAPVVPGNVNFINNVTYGGSPAQLAIGSGITLGVH